MNDKLKKSVSYDWVSSPNIGLDPSRFATAEAIVDKVDAGSSGTADAYDNDDFEVELVNDGEVDNGDYSKVDTGDNSINDADDLNTIGTGGATADTLSDSFLNTNHTEISGGGASAHATVSNVTDGSTGTAYAKDNDDLEVDIENCQDDDCDFWNDSEARAYTGDNHIYEVDDENSVTTGAADSFCLGANSMNHNQTEITGWGNSAWATVEEIDGGSTGTATAYDKDDFSLWVDNEGVMDNDSTAKSDTGDNSINNADDLNTIGTGGATAEAGATNFLNTNETIVSGESDSAHATVSNVTDGSTGTAYAKDNDEYEVDIENYGEVDNQSTAKAYTGDNEISNVDDENSITTGDGTATSSSSNVVNTNVTTIEF